METGKWIKSSAGYARSLAGSGWEGMRAAEKASLGEASVGSVLVGALRDSWMPAAIGAYVGALGASLAQRRKPQYGTLAGAGLLGAVVGLTTGMLWETRRLTGDMARGARKNMDAVRDAHWLEKNPVPYG